MLRVRHVSIVLVILGSCAASTTLGLVGIANQPTTYVLSGRVTNQSGNPFAGSLVDVLDPGTVNVRVGTTTDQNGDYSLQLDAGTYDVRVTPAAGSGFGLAVAPGRVVAADAELDFVLVPAGSALLSGQILDGLGQPLANQSVSLSLAGGVNLPAVITDGDGAYSFATSPGDYSLGCSGSPRGSSAAPHDYNLFGVPVALTAGTLVVDLQLPVKPVTVRVQDPEGNPVPGVALITPGVYNPALVLSSGLPAIGTSSYYSWADPPVTNAEGEATMWLFPSAYEAGYERYTITAAPPANSPFAMAHVQDVAVTTDTAVTITLAAPVLLRGRVLDGLGQPLANQSVSLSLAGGINLPPTVTDANGAYAFAAAPGNYVLGSSGSSREPSAAPHDYDLHGVPVALTTGTVVVDLQLPVRRVAVHVQDPEGNPVPGVALITPGVYNPALVLPSGLPAIGTSSYDSLADPLVTNATGDAVMWLFPSAYEAGYERYTITAAPPANSPFAMAHVQDVAVTTDTAVTITLAAPVLLRGRVLDGLGQPLANQSVSLRLAGGINLPPAVTDASGAYAFAAAPGNYVLGSSGSSREPSAAPHDYDLHGVPVALTTGTVVVDLQLPVRRVAVHVQDLGGHPIANVALTTQGVYNPALVLPSGLPAIGTSSYFGWADQLVTNATGDAVMWLFPSAYEAGYERYTITAAPPADSPFVTFNVQDVAVEGDKEIFVVLQFVHDSPVTAITLSPAPDTAGVYPDPVTVALSATASPGFTVGATTYAVDGGPTQTYGEPFVVGGPGNHTILYWSVDNTGVYEIAKTADIRIDDRNNTAVVWVGLKNSDAVGIRFDLLAEVSMNGVLVGSGQANHVRGGSSGFNNAVLTEIPMTVLAHADVGPGSDLAITVFVRNTCFGTTQNSGAARLWFNDTGANSHFGVTIGPETRELHLLSEFALSAAPGPGPRQHVDVPAGKPCSEWKSFGTWRAIIQ